MSKSFLIKDIDKLNEGNCVVCIKNKDTGSMRYAEGSVAPIPYTKDATPEIRAKYGKNLVYVIYRDNEDVVGYYQNRFKNNSGPYRRNSDSKTGKSCSIIDSNLF